MACLILQLEYFILHFQDLITKNYMIDFDVLAYVYTLTLQYGQGASQAQF